MIELIKPGHVLHFNKCPSSIHSPKADGSSKNDNKLETPWPKELSSFGKVQCRSFVTGTIGKIAADVAGKLGEKKKSRLSGSDEVVGEENCAFVGYTDGKSFYVESDKTVFSKDFSGCLFVAYEVGGKRRVAHVAASKEPSMDCKQAFLNTIKGKGAKLKGWFRPFIDARDGEEKFAAMKQVMKYLKDPYSMTTFGVMTAKNVGYSIDAFKPEITKEPYWVVTKIQPRKMSTYWSFKDIA